MRNNFDRFLLGVLWLLAVVLGACFWFNIRYGFNIFSSAHWKYLAYLQASQSPIQSMFYVSLILAVVIAMVGLYLLVRPRRRKIKLAPSRPAAPNVPVPMPTSPTSQTVAQATPQPVAPASTQSQSAPASPVSMMRPMRPNTTTPSSFDAVPPPNQPAATPAQPVAPASTPEYPEIRDIFANNGWVVKRAPRIDGVPIALMAIGADEQLWLGGVGISTDDLRRAMDKLAQVFSDTLDDIFINVNGFVVAARNARSPETNVLTFDGMSDLATYMSAHKNPPLSDTDAENFNAYSEYIDTVIEYIGKV